MQHRSSLLTGDWHITDSPLDLYRWDIFEPLKQIIFQYSIDDLYILGDLSDRKDRHASKLINPLVDKFIELKDDTGVEITITAGNHDAPLTGPYFWDFLNHAGVKYVREPELKNDIYLLPFSPDPITDWQGLKLSHASAIFIHQTVEGAWVEGNRKISGMKYEMPILPRGIPVFSGDVHRPQQVGQIIYIGAPYPVRFSEDWKCRVLVVENGDFKNYKEVSIPHIKRGILDIKSASELNGQQFKTGDQVRIRVHLSKDKLSNWIDEETAINKWAKDHDIMLISLESILDDVIDINTHVQQGFELLKPEDVIDEFCRAQNVDEVTRDIGIEILRSIG